MLREPAGRGGSAYVHDTLRPGQVVGFAAPRNHLRLEPSALLYGGRTAASMAFTGELAGYGKRVTVHPQDTHGLLDLDTLLGTPRPDTLVYVCGPEALLRAVEERMVAWPEGSLHLERFAVPETPARDAADEHAVEVVLAESGRTVMVGPQTSILTALLEDGVDVLHDCTEGICGSCETKVLERSSTTATTC